jgi:hypothetical protein
MFVRNRVYPGMKTESVDQPSVAGVRTQIKALSYRPAFHADMLLDQDFMLEWGKTTYDRVLYKYRFSQLMKDTASDLWTDMVATSKLASQVPHLLDASTSLIFDQQLHMCIGSVLDALNRIDIRMDVNNLSDSARDEEARQLLSHMYSAHILLKDLFIRLKKCPV